MTNLETWLHDPAALEIGQSEQSEKLKSLREYVAIWLSGQENLPRTSDGLVGPDEESKSGCAVSPSPIGR